jgi:RNA recognition motif-containing protein
MGTRLFVGNLPFSVREDNLKDYFENNGFPVISVKVATERDTGRSRGYGFVDVQSEDDVRRAIQELNGKQLEGRALTIDAAKGERRANH